MKLQTLMTNLMNSGMTPSSCLYCLELDYPTLTLEQVKSFYIKGTL